MSDLETQINEAVEVQEALEASTAQSRLKALDAAFESYSSRARTIATLDFTLWPTHVTTKIGDIDKSISLVDFRSMLDLSMGENNTKEVPQISLPFGVYTFGRTDSEIQMSCYYQSARRTIKHQGNYDNSRRVKDWDIIFPNFIISHKLVKRDNFWVVTETRYFVTNKSVGALPEDKIVWSRDEANGIFLPPFTNVYDQGNLCYGGNSMPNKFTSNLRGLDYYFQILTLSPFNNDMGVRGLANHRNPEEWYKHLSEQTEFPYNELAGYRS